MGKLFKNRWALAAAAALLAVAIAAYLEFRPQYGTAAKLVGLLPKSNALLMFAEVDLLRRGGFLKSLETAKPAEDADYKRFVNETGFSYAADLDAIAIASLPDQLFAVARGRFDWERLRRYAVANGGECHGRYCQAPASKPGRWVSFLPLERDVIGIAVSPDSAAAYSLLPRRGAPLPATPAFPVWAEIPKRLLEQPDALPPGVQVFARALASASGVTLGVTATQGGALKLDLRAVCDTEMTANNVRDHLNQIGKMLKSVTARNPGVAGTPGLLRVLTSGTFESEGRTATGGWVVPPSVAASLFD